MAPFDLDIGVVYTHERELMPRLLSTMAASGDGLRMRLILVDNASADGAEQWCRHFRNTKILRNSRRLSYAVNLNRVLSASTARYVLLLNTDMYFDPPNRCLARMAALMDVRPECGIAGCRLFHADGGEAHAARRFPTLPLVLARRGGLGWLLRQTVRRHFYADRAGDETWSCDWLSGCFLWLRRTAVEKSGRSTKAMASTSRTWISVCGCAGRAGRSSTTAPPPATTWRLAPAGTCSRPTPGSIFAPTCVGFAAGASIRPTRPWRGSHAPDRPARGVRTPDNVPLPLAMPESVLNLPLLGAECRGSAAANSSD